MIAAGGFGANKPMLRAHAPHARGGLPLATPGDDGSGISLGTGAGGATALLDRVSLWRFLSPPPALLHGVIVDRAGRRVCDESRYGAAVGDEIARRGGQAWLLVDRATLAQARRQVRGTTLWFQRLQARYLLTSGRVTAGTVAGVAAKAGVDPEGLAATLAAYNVAAAKAAAGSAAVDDGPGPSPDPAGKPPGLLVAQDQPPYSLIDISVRPRLLYPAPVLTLGGLVVDPGTGLVLRPDGTPVPGLYAAGPQRGGPVLAVIRQRAVHRRLRLLGWRAGRHAAAARPPQ